MKNAVLMHFIILSPGEKLSKTDRKKKTVKAEWLPFIVRNNDISFEKRVKTRTITHSLLAHSLLTVRSQWKEKRPTGERRGMVSLFWVYSK